MRCCVNIEWGRMEITPMVTETIETCVCAHAHVHVQSCFGVKALQSSRNWENEVFYCAHIAIWVYCCHHHDLTFITCL